MAKQYIHTEVEGQKIKLSNLDKILYPSIAVNKAEVINYYLEIAPHILKYIKDRPLTLIRFPNNIEKNKFYAKSKPDWTPQWIHSKKIQHSEDSIDYIVAHNTASVVWLANLAALELHPMQMTVEDMGHPDHFIFDLDPADDGDFESVKEIAFNLNNFLREYGYTPYVKTSGSKGIHIFVPILKEYTHEEMVESVKGLAKVFVQKYKDTCTLAMSKEKRRGKTLIDIFRNHESHTTVAPYSLRGKAGAPISFPLSWNKLEDIKSAQDITIKNYKDYLSDSLEAWDNFYNEAKELHNQKKVPDIIDQEVVKKLSDYMGKRDFNLSPEPSIDSSKALGNRFCIQLHDASNLHYDLRLEDGGVLLSWAIPKGLPHQLKVKRMAIRTEDHPLKYLDFEGTIPKGQYGAGEMWVVSKGKIEWIEKSETKYKFKLIAPLYNRSFSLFRTKDNQWLIEMMDNKDFAEVEMPILPMLAKQISEVPTATKYIYEIKWDGIRAIFYINKDTVKIFSRSGRELTSKFPELTDPDYFDIESGIFDGEIVNLDEKGRPIFSNVISRMHSEGENNILRMSKSKPVVAYLFDCIFLDGKYVTEESLVRRQAWLKTCLKKQSKIRISEAFKDGKALFKASKEMNLEGIMAKDKNAKYKINTRNESWLKIKNRTEEECLIAGYTKGEGDRSALFGALHLLKEDEEGIRYMGKVGTGFDSKKMKNLLEEFEKLKIEKKAFDSKTDDDYNSVWLNPKLKCKIQFASLSSNGTYREPVFIKLIL